MSGESEALTRQSYPDAAAGQFRAVVDFLHRHGYRIQHGYGGDPAYKGGHTLRHLAELYAKDGSR